MVKSVNGNPVGGEIDKAGEGWPNGYAFACLLLPVYHFIALTSFAITPFAPIPYPACFKVLPFAAPLNVSPFCHFLPIYLFIALVGYAVFPSVSI